MKIKDVITETGLLKGLFKSITPKAVDAFQKWKQTRTDKPTREGFRYKDYFINWNGKTWLSWNYDERKYEPAPLEIQRELDALASGQVPTPSGASTEKPTRRKKGLEVMVDGPRELTIRYDGQLYTTRGGDAPWVLTKSQPEKAVSPSFGKVLDQEYRKYCQDHETQSCNIDR